MLLLGDCLDRLPELEAGSVDLTVTSPPYDNLRTYNGSLNDWSAEKWQAVISELFRVTKQGGVVVWVVGDATIKGSETGTSFRQAIYAMECGFRLHDTMIWEKDGRPLTHNRYEQRFEFMFVWSKSRPSTFNGIKDKPNVGSGRVMTGTWRDSDGSKKRISGHNTKTVAEMGLRPNIWFERNCRGRRSNDHPAPFPESLARDHILSWSNPGETVLDPFLGSGTTAKMAMVTGRKFIGIERDPEYMAIAERRIAEAQPTLLAAE